MASVYLNRTPEAPTSSTSSPTPTSVAWTQPTCGAMPAVPFLESTTETASSQSSTASFTSTIAGISATCLSLRWRGGGMRSAVPAHVLVTVSPRRRLSTRTATLFTIWDYPPRTSGTRRFLLVLCLSSTPVVRGDRVRALSVCVALTRRRTGICVSQLMLRTSSNTLCMTWVMSLVSEPGLFHSFFP